MGGENLRERGEGFGVESGDGFERDVERGDEVRDEAAALKGSDEIELHRVETVGAGLQLMPHRSIVRFALHHFSS